MVKRIALFAWSVRHQFFKYVVVGTSTVFLDLLALRMLVRYMGLQAHIAVILDQPFLIAFNFFINKHWSFGSTAFPHKQILRYLILAGWNYFFSFSAMYIFNYRLGFHYQIVRIGSIMVMVLWNFLLFKYWVYRGDDQERGLGED